MNTAERTESNTVFCQDCLQGLKNIPNRSIDLVVTDPPYLIENTKAGGKSKLAKSIQHMNNQIQENHLVLDPFLGSGTTAVAAALNNRRYIGFEINEEYFDVTCKRLDEAEGKKGMIEL